MKGDQESTAFYQSKEFVSVSFSPKNEKHSLLTLTGEPDYTLILWKWDASKIQAMINIGFSNPQGTPHFQCSFNPFEQNSVVVTGPNTYKYLKIQDTEFVIDHSQLNNYDRGGYIGKEESKESGFACHAWMQDTARLIVCTLQGEILICENSGEFYAFIEKDDRQQIKCIVPYNRGFVVGWSNGLFTAYERFEDPQTGANTYRRFKEIQTHLENPY